MKLLFLPPEKQKNLHQVGPPKAKQSMVSAKQSSMAEEPEKHEFQTEVKRLLDTAIVSMYTDTQVFLRELVLGLRSM